MWHYNASFKALQFALNITNYSSFLLLSRYCTGLTTLLYLCLGVLSLGWTSLCLRVLEGLNCTGMSCFWRILLNFSKTPDRYTLDPSFLGSCFLEVLEMAQSG